MIRSLAKTVLCGALLLSSGCRDWMEDEGTGTGIPVPSDTCICAQACGVPVIDNTHWVDHGGTRHGLGQCYPASAERLSAARNSCQCEYFATVPPAGGRPSPNH